MQATPTEATAAAARWLKDWGVLERGEYEDLDLSAYSSKRAKEWGAYGCGGKGEKELDEVAKEHPATSVALVETFEEAGAAIESGFPSQFAQVSGSVRPATQMAFVGLKVHGRMRCALSR